MSSVSLYGSHLLLYCYYYYSFYGDEGSSHPFMCRMEYFWWLWVWHSFFFFFKYFLLLASWVLGEWTSCTVTCGDGIQTRDLTCKQEISPTLTMRVNEAACLGTAPSVPRVRNCNLGHCAKWHTSDWGKVRNFFIFFVFVLFEKIYIFSICHLWYISAINVESLVLCFVIDNWRMWIECFYLVVLSPYTSFIIKCSTSCGKGMRHRRVYCQGFDGRDVGESDCSSAEKPSSSDICDMGSCSAKTCLFTEWSGQVRLWPVFLSIKKKIYSTEDSEEKFTIF